MPINSTTTPHDTKTWEQILQALPSPCLVVDDQAVVNAINPPALKVLGVEIDQILNQTLFEALPYLKKSPLARSFSSLVTSAPAPEPFEFEVCLPNGNSVRFAAKATVADSAGRQSLAMTIHDFSDVARLKKQLRHTEYRATVGKIARGIAHELNNPLDGVLRYTELALERLPEGTQEREYIIHVREGLDRMVRAVRSFLEMARQITTPVSRLANLNQLIDDALLLVHHRAKFQNIEVVKQLQSPLPPVADAGLQYAIVNLVKNAFDAMPEKGKLTIRSWYADQHVFVEVGDTGPGISEESCGRIFEPFFSTKPLHQGSGLGLTIAKEAVERSGGDIGFTSVMGTGTTFRIRVPVAPKGV